MFTCRTHEYDLAFIIGSFIAIILGRAANIYPISFILNLVRNTKIPWNSQHMLFLSGLRGAIAFGLSVNLTLTPSRTIIRTTTQIIILVTVIISGGSTMNVLKWLKIPTGISEQRIFVTSIFLRNKFCQKKFIIVTYTFSIFLPTL